MKLITQQYNSILCLYLFGENMKKKASGLESWSLILVRSGGYKIDNELNDALFSFGRTPNEVLMISKNNLTSRLPEGVKYLLRKNNLADVALESGFIIDFSTKNKNESFDLNWDKFERIISSIGINSSSDKCFSGLYYSVNSLRIQCFEMLAISDFEGNLPFEIWIRVRPLDSGTIAWAISQNNLITSGEKEQKSLDDFFDFNLPELIRTSLPLPGPPSG